MTDITALYEHFLKCGSVSTDSRSIQTGSLYFALRGANFDGNNFAREALEKGASYAVIDNAELKSGDQYILVDDVLISLQDLAHHHRSRFDIPVIAITGSNGKTTTKELMRNVLSTKYKVYSTEGNFNNHIGLPLTLLKLKEEHEMAIVEMGANQSGEIAALCRIASPNFGLITNIGKAHLEGFGSYEGVKKTKLDLYRFVEDAGGTLFVHSDDDLLMEESRNCRRITYGTKNADITGRMGTDELGRISVNFIMQSEETIVKTNLFGAYNFSNLLAAVCAGFHFSVKPSEIGKALAGYSPKNNRSQIIETEKNTVIMDAYNANPSSMKLALKSFDALKCAKKMVILGDMLELGESAGAEHAEIVKFLTQQKIDRIYLVGKEFSAIPSEFRSFIGTSDCFDQLELEDIEGYAIMIKGSRGMELEKLIDAIG